MSPEQVLAEAGAVYLDSSALVKLAIAEPPGDREMRVLYMSTVPLYTSSVGFGEMIGCLGRKPKQNDIGGPEGFLFGVRMILMDFQVGKLRTAEPPESRFEFARMTQDSIAIQASLGGGDLWHSMAARELARTCSSTVFRFLSQKCN